jgi:hypothetical protein
MHVGSITSVAHYYPLNPMNHFFRHTALFCSALLTQSLTAQSPDSAPTKRMGLIDPAAFGFGQPGFVFDASWIDTQNVEDQSGALDYAEWRMIAPVGARKRGDFLWAASLGYNLTEVNFTDIKSVQDDTLHTLELQITGLWRPSATRWSAMAFVTPGVSTDFEGISADDLECTGLGLINYRLSDEWTFAGGAFGRYETDDSMLVPAFGFIWRREPFVVQMTPPFAVIGWRATDKLTLSLSAYPSGGSWDLDQADVNRLEVSGWQSAASVIYQFTDHWSVSFRGGVNFGGELEVLDRENRAIVEEDLQSAAFGAVNIRYSF